MSSFDSSNQELDFEDKLANFEQNFSQCDRGRRQYHNRPINSRKQKTERSGMTAGEIEQELLFLWKELITHIPVFQGMATTSARLEDADFAGQLLRSDISREVFRAEIRTMLSQIRNLQTLNCDDINDLPSSQKATFRSLKRILSERTEQLEALKRTHRQVESQKHRLEETVEKLSNSLLTCKKAHTPLENKTNELQEQNAGLRKKLSEHEEAAKRFGAERKRFQSTIARYREELQLANHQTETAELELKQSKERCDELEKRARETRASSSALSSRIGELHDVQDLMIQVMKEARNATDPGAVRRTLQDLGERRSRLVGRIANLLTKNHEAAIEDSSPPGAEGAAVTSTGALTNTDNTGSSPALLATEPSTAAFPNNNSGGSSEIHDVGNESTGNRKPFLEGIRKLGNDLTRVATSRNRNELTKMASPRLQRKAILDNVEKTRVAIENDISLREVIEVKEKELERMEDELYRAKEKAATLERSLQKERHKRRLENHTVNASPGEQVSVEASKVILTRRRSLFEWQSGDVKNTLDAQSSEDNTSEERENALETHNAPGIEEGVN